jgi:hypothetical protein
MVSDDRVLRIDVTVNTTADPAAVWKLVADVGTWSEWGQWSSAEIERPGSSEPGGVGAIRSFKYRGRETREEVVALDPPRRYAYTMLSGLPLRSYRAEVTVVPAGEGAVLEWHSLFEPTVAGRLWRPFLARFIRDTAKRLVRAAEG